MRCLASIAQSVTTKWMKYKVMESETHLLASSMERFKSRLSKKHKLHVLTSFLYNVNRSGCSKALGQDLSSK